MLTFAHSISLYSSPGELKALLLLHLLSSKVIRLHKVFKRYLVLLLSRREIISVHATKCPDPRNSLAFPHGCSLYFGSLLHYTSILTFLEEKYIRPGEWTSLKMSTSSTRKESGQPPVNLPQRSSIGCTSQQLNRAQLQAPWGKDSDPPFTDAENEAQKDGTTGPKTYSKLGVNTGAKPSASKSSISLASGLIKSPIPRNQEKRFRQT